MLDKEEEIVSEKEQDMAISLYDFWYDGQQRREQIVSAFSGFSSEEYIQLMLVTGYDPLHVLNELFDIRELLWL